MQKLEKEVSEVFLIPVQAYGIVYWHFRTLGTFAAGVLQAPGVTPNEDVGTLILDLGAWIG